MNSFAQTCRELQYKFLKIVRNKQSSLRIKFDGKVIYIDPFGIDESNFDADYIFITHDHYDHFDKKSLANIIKPQTIIITNQVVAKVLVDEAIQDPKNIKILSLEDHLDLDKWISIDAMPAYNIDKFNEAGELYHTKELGGIGFVITISKDEEQVKLYHMGDTDFLQEHQVVEGIDLLFIPIGGKYVMNWKEAVLASNQINPLVCIPMHFDSDDNGLKDAEKFINELKMQGEII